MRQERIFFGLLFGIIAVLAVIIMWPFVAVSHLSFFPQAAGPAASRVGIVDNGGAAVDGAAGFLPHQ